MEFKSYYASHIDDYIKLKKSIGYKFNTETSELKRFDSFLYKNNITNITFEIIEKLILEKSNWSINGKSRSIIVINGFCNYLINNNIINSFTLSKNVYKQKTRKYQPYIFSYEEIKKIVYYADNYYSKNYFEMKYIMSFLIRLLYGTGMRLGEALSIEKRNIDYEKGIIKLINTKNNEERLIILTDDLTKRLNNYLKKMNKNTKYLFYTKDGNKCGHSVIELNFYKILNSCNITRTDQGPRIHDLRFTFITHSFNKYIKTGKDPLYFLPLLMTYVGHKSISSTEYYLKQTIESINFIKKATECYLRGNDNES